MTINTKTIIITVVLLLQYCHYYFTSEVEISNEANARNKRGWQMKKSGLSPALKSSALHPRPIGHSTIYSLALLDVVTFLPVMLGRHVQMSPGTTMTVSSVGLKRDHP
jgi:hypothetical protein